MMSDQEQTIQDSKNKDFGQMPHWVVDQGILKILKGSEVKVYITLNRYADYETKISWPTVDQLSEATGCRAGAIAKATDRLVELKLIEKSRSGKRFNFRNIYKIIRDPNIYRCIVPLTVDKRKGGSRGGDGKFVQRSKHGGECAGNDQQCVTPQMMDKSKDGAFIHQMRINAQDLPATEPVCMDEAYPPMMDKGIPSMMDKRNHPSLMDEIERHIETTRETEEERKGPLSDDSSGKELTPFDSQESEDVVTTDGLNERRVKASSRAYTPVQEVGNHFAELYESMTRQPFKHSKKDFCIIARLLKEFGPEAVINKINVLAAYCQRGEVWFAKQGIADFTIGNLSAQWNRLILQVRLTPEEIKQQEFQEALKKERELAERFSE